MEKHSDGLWWVGFIGTVLILGAFAISSLMLTNVGIGVYRNVVSANNENFELRTSLNYVATKVRQNDNGEAKIIRKDGVDVLALNYMGSLGYRVYVYIYHYNGSLREHSCLEFDPFELDLGFEMMEIADFDMSLDGNLLTLKATNKAGESESLVLSLRAEGSDLAAEN